MNTALYTLYVQSTGFVIGKGEGMYSACRECYGM
jgi:hypothetical protein